MNAAMIPSGSVFQSGALHELRSEVSKGFSQGQAAFALLTRGGQADKVYRECFDHKPLFGRARTSEHLQRIVHYPSRKVIPCSESHRAVLLQRLWNWRAENGMEPEDSALARAEVFASLITETRQTFYSLPDGKLVPTGTVLILPNGTKGGPHFLRTRPGLIEPLLREVAELLERLRAIPRAHRSSPENIEIFCKALYGYFQAYPYEFGTEQIGWAIFSGFFHSLYGKRLHAHLDSENLHAFMSNSERGFISNILPYIKASFHE